MSIYLAAVLQIFYKDKCADDAHKKKPAVRTIHIEFHFARKHYFCIFEIPGHAIFRPTKPILLVLLSDTYLEFSFLVLKCVRGAVYFLQNTFLTQLSIDLLPGCLKLLFSNAQSLYNGPFCSFGKDWRISWRCFCPIIFLLQNKVQYTLGDLFETFAITLTESS